MTFRPLLAVFGTLAAWAGIATAQEQLSVGALASHFAQALDCGPGECAEIEASEGSRLGTKNLSGRAATGQVSPAANAAPESPAIVLVPPPTGGETAPVHQAPTASASAPAAMEIPAPQTGTARMEAPAAAEMPPPPSAEAPAPVAAASVAPSSPPRAAPFDIEEVTLPAEPGFDIAVRFERGSSRFDPATEGNLQTVADAMLGGELVGARFLIAAHTSAEGGDAQNLSLSRIRALKVKLALVDLGVAPDRLAVVGFGESRPLPGLAADADGQSRVELHLMR